MLVWLTEVISRFLLGKHVEVSNFEQHHFYGAIPGGIMRLGCFTSFVVGEARSSHFQLCVASPL
jgi:hypothetical protein